MKTKLAIISNHMKDAQKQLKHYLQLVGNFKRQIHIEGQYVYEVTYYNAKIEKLYAEYAEAFSFIVGNGVEV